MTRSPTRATARTGIAWLAMAALLVGALLPGWARALAVADGSRVTGWTEVCSAQGSRWVRTANAAPDTPVHGIVAWLEHCRDCLAHAEPSVPPSPDSALRLPAGVSQAPAVVATGPAAPDAGRRHPPARGPPAAR